MSEADTPGVDMMMQKRAIEELEANAVALEAERANLQTIFNAAHVGMILVNDDTTILRVNDVVERLIGRSGKDMVGLQPGDGLYCMNALANLRGCGHGEKCANCLIRNTVEKVLATGKEVRGVEASITLKLGGEPKELWFSLNVSPVAMSGQRSVLVSLMDISERKWAENELKENLLELERFNRLMLGRENRVLELKKEVNDLLAAAGQPPRYQTAGGILSSPQGELDP